MYQVEQWRKSTSRHLHICSAIKSQMVYGNLIGLSRQVNKKRWFATAFLCQIFLGGLQSKNWLNLDWKIWWDQIILQHPPIYSLKENDADRVGTCKNKLSRSDRNDCSKVITRTGKSGKWMIRGWCPVYSPKKPILQFRSKGTK